MIGSRVDDAILMGTTGDIDTGDRQCQRLPRSTQKQTLYPALVLDPSSLPPPSTVLSRVPLSSISYPNLLAYFLISDVQQLWIRRRYQSTTDQ